jgi:hypothetical protein
MVQVVATHAVTLPWNMGFVQMHALSVGVQVFVPNALRRHSCWGLSVRDQGTTRLADSQHTLA